MHEVHIGGAKRAAVGYELSELSLVPSKRTRNSRLIDVSWVLDAYALEIPILGAPLDASMSPDRAVDLNRLGGCGVLNLEGLWTRFEQPEQIYAELADLRSGPEATQKLREAYAQPVQDDLIGQRIEEMGGTGVVAGCLRPGKVARHHQAALEAGLELLVVHGVTVTAQHVGTPESQPLDLRDFTARYDIPVIVGGVSSRKSALHLMRTGAVGVLVGTEASSVSTNDQALGIRVPLGTAIAEVAAARSRYLEESGRYVNVIVAGGVASAGDLVRSIACGADAVMLGRSLARATGAPGRGAYWGPSAAHGELPRSGYERVATVGSMEQILFGPADREDGTTNLIGGLRRAMGVAGFESLAQLRDADLMVRR